METIDKGRKVTFESISEDTITTDNLSVFDDKIRNDIEDMNEKGLDLEILRSGFDPKNVGKKVKDLVKLHEEGKLYDIDKYRSKKDRTRKVDQVKEITLKEALCEILSNVRNHKKEHERIIKERKRNMQENKTDDFNAKGISKHLIFVDENQVYVALINQVVQGAIAQGVTVVGQGHLSQNTTQNVPIMSQGGFVQGAIGQGGFVQGEPRNSIVDIASGLEEKYA